jgi:hypothetical protein
VISHEISLHQGENPYLIAPRSDLWGSSYWFEEDRIIKDLRVKNFFAL